MQIPGFSRAITSQYDWNNARPSFYIYSLSVTVPANGQVSKAITIKRDAPFSITEIATRSDSVAHGLTNVSMQVTDTGSGSTLFSDPVDVGVLNTTDAGGLVLPAPYEVSNSATLSVSLANTANADVQIEVAFIGVKLLSRTLNANLRKS